MAAEIGTEIMATALGHRDPGRLLREPLWTWIIITGSITASTVLTVILSESGVDRDAALFLSLLLVSPLVAWRLVRRQHLALQAHCPELLEGRTPKADRGGVPAIPATIADSSAGTDGPAKPARPRRSRRARREGRDAREAQRWLRAIDPRASAVLQVRSLLIVQFIDAQSGQKRVVARSLTRSQRDFLRKNPLILNEPPERVVEEVLRA